MQSVFILQTSINIIILPQLAFNVSFEGHKFWNSNFLSEEIAFLSILIKTKQKKNISFNLLCTEILLKRIEIKKWFFKISFF